MRTTGHCLTLCHGFVPLGHGFLPLGHGFLPLGHGCASVSRSMFHSPVHVDVCLSMLCRICPEEPLCHGNQHVWMSCTAPWCSQSSLTPDFEGVVRWTQNKNGWDLACGVVWCVILLSPGRGRTVRYATATNPGDRLLTYCTMSVTGRPDRRLIFVASHIVLHRTRHKVRLRTNTVSIAKQNWGGGREKTKPDNLRMNSRHCRILNCVWSFKYSVRWRSSLLVTPYKKENCCAQCFFLQFRATIRQHTPHKHIFTSIHMKLPMHPHTTAYWQNYTSTQKSSQITWPNPHHTSNNMIHKPSTGICPQYDPWTLYWYLSSIWSMNPLLVCILDMIHEPSTGMCLRYIAVEPWAGMCPRCMAVWRWQLNFMFSSDIM